MIKCKTTSNTIIKDVPAIARPKKAISVEKYIGFREIL